MENFFNILTCHEFKFKVYLDISNSDLLKKVSEVNRNKKQIKKFTLALEAVKQRIENKTQYNWEDKCDLGDIYAIKVDNHRFYCISTTNYGFRELYICRYGRKQTQQNDKKLKATIQSISQISIQKLLE